jgi:hypothetical protein
MTDDEATEAVAALRILVAALEACADRATIADMERRLLVQLDEQPLTDEVVLYGFEGQVDARCAVDGRPPTLEMAIPQRLRWEEATELDVFAPSYRTAVYRRAGDHTYVREC